MDWVGVAAAATIGGGGWGRVGEREGGEKIACDILVIKN